MSKKLSVCAIVQDREGRMVLQHSINRGWELMGGKMEAGEHPDDAIRRELFEETGLTGVALRLLGSFEHDDWCCLCYQAVMLPDDWPIDKEPEKVDGFGPFTMGGFFDACKDGEVWDLAELVVRKFYDVLDLPEIAQSGKYLGPDLPPVSTEEPDGG